MKKLGNLIPKILSYIIVAALASAVTLFVFDTPPGKLDQLQKLLEQRFIGEADSIAIEDAGARAMIAALGDRWSYYISADDYQSYEEQKKNAYVGIGVTIRVRTDELGFDVVKVEAGGSAKEEGVLPGDILTEVDGQQAYPLGADGISNLIRGKEGTTVKIAVLRNGERKVFTLTRKTMQVAVATDRMLEGNVGLITIKNFNEKCASESKAAIDRLIEQGAKALIFDVRNNPGGYVSELTELLDYLLPECVVFRSVDYTGREQVIRSDAEAVQIPMAVLVNGESYSAAEFFAAALEEFDLAVIVGEPTCGKGYFQTTYHFSDGSAVGLSIGKYFTPKGVSLAEVGGLVPEILEEVDEQTAALIYAGLLEPENDPQMQAAVRALQEQQ